jgi:hypothetical protein
MLIASGLLN